LQEIAVRACFLFRRRSAIFSKGKKKQNNPRSVSKSCPGIAVEGVFAGWEVERFFCCAVFAGGALEEVLWLGVFPDISMLSFDLGREGLQKGETFALWVQPIWIGFHTIVAPAWFRKFYLQASTRCCRARIAHTAAVCSSLAITTRRLFLVWRPPSSKVFLLFAGRLDHEKPFFFEGANSAKSFLHFLISSGCERVAEGQLY